MTTETTENRIDWPCVAKTITTRMDGSWTDAGGGYEVVVQTVNSNGGHVMPTISADECKGAQAQKDNRGGYCVHSFVQLRTVRESSRGSDRRALREEMP